MSGKYLIKLLIAFCLLLLAFTSCSDKITFTQDIRKKLESQNIDIRKIQFYNSKRVVLNRKLNSVELNVSAGDLKYTGGIYYEKIVIEKGTPAVCDSMDDYVLYISFEQCKNFPFSRYYNNLFNQDYKLLLNKSFVKSNEIDYDYNTYHVLTPTDKLYLKIKRNNLKNLFIDKRILPGMKVQ